ncbi:hypothetical protein J4N02_11120 [Propioniciclava sp. MC1595]|uniref:hypothetical protein n=1 Tax=Propioniciclava sp. MC1595 TaxID=2760308 RepID=UPI0016627186|nr:hypothetical protein [Propioniciclava sp. MC1595]MBB1493699.1 hypothetical protein [Propioniciclava sp. MC1595]QTE25093.1 hypothetical protein J4N02_11120 [Propioniciclava sp. MC1595]
MTHDMFNEVSLMVGVVGDRELPPYQVLALDVQGAWDSAMKSELRDIPPRAGITDGILFDIQERHTSWGADAAVLEAVLHVLGRASDLAAGAVLGEVVRRFFEKVSERMGEASHLPIPRDGAINTATWRVALAYGVDRGSLIVTRERELVEGGWVIGLRSLDSTEYSVEVTPLGGGGVQSLITRFGDNPSN